MNLIEALQQANDKSRDHLADLDRVAKAMHGESATVDDDRGLRMSAGVTRGVIAATDRAIASGDVLVMLSAAKLHGLEFDIGTVEEANRREAANREERA